MRHFKFLFSVILFLFIPQSFIFSEPAPDSQSGNEIKTDYAFAEKLYSEGDYRGSTVELKRFLYYAAADQDLRKPERLLIKCYASLGEKSDLKKNLKEYVKKYKEEEADIYFDLSKTFYLSKQYECPGFIGHSSAGVIISLWGNIILLCFLPSHYL